MPRDVTMICRGEATSSSRPPHSEAARLGLPPAIRACLFDLDGVLTQTAQFHAAAWKETFDPFLRRRAAQGHGPYAVFDEADFERYVDGKPRADGVRSFLAARGVELPEGDTHDAPIVETIHGLANRKNDLVRALIERVGVRVYDDSCRYVGAVRAAGLRCAVVSASANCRVVLEAAGIAPLFEVVVDGLTAARCRLRGKPAPDTFLAAARLLAVEPREAAVFEDALAGVEAGRDGGFGYVVGVDRGDRADALRAHGADVVVTDLTALLRAPEPGGRSNDVVPRRGRRT